MEASLAAVQALIQAAPRGGDAAEIVQLVADSPQDPALLATYGNHLFHNGRYDEAARAFALSAMLRPSWSAWIQAGDSEAAAGRFDAAEEAYRHADRLAPSALDASRRLIAAKARFGTSAQRLQVLRAPCLEAETFALTFPFIQGADFAYGAHDEGMASEELADLLRRMCDSPDMLRAQSGRLGVELQQVFFDIALVRRDINLLNLAKGFLPQARYQEYLRHPFGHYFSRLMTDRAAFNQSIRSDFLAWGRNGRGSPEERLLLGLALAATAKNSDAKIVLDTVPAELRCWLFWLVLAEQNEKLADYAGVRVAFEALGRAIAAVPLQADPAFWQRFAVQRRQTGVATANLALWRSGTPPICRTTPLPPMRNVDVFIKTYAKDHQWIPFCVASLRAGATGFRRIVIVTDLGSPLQVEPDSRLPTHIAFAKVPDVPAGIPSEWLPHGIGYWWQQVVKMSWTDYTDADAVYILDSDCMISRPVDAGRDILREGQPRWHIRPWSDAGQSREWKAGTDHFLGFESEHSYMRLQGFVLTRAATLAYQEYLRRVHGLSVTDFFIKSPMSLKPSEFETFGAFLHHIDCHGYVVEAQPDEDHYIHQFWSWSGITSEVRAKADKLLASLRAAGGTAVGASPVA